MRFLIFFLCSAFIAKAQLKPILLQVKKDTIIRWDYHFGDEFNSNQFNLEKWYDTYSWGGLIPDQRIYSAPEMVSQKDGILHLGAKKTNEWREFPDWMLNADQAKKMGIELKEGAMQLDYLTSCIWSRQDFKYGYFECRCKAPSGKGLWPAFWLYGQNQKDEIDFMEMKGEYADKVHVDIHCPDNCDKTPSGLFGVKKDWGGWVKMEGDLTDEWVVFSGVWMPNSLTYYVNGVAVSHFNGDFATPMNVIANLSVARDNGPFEPGPDDKTKFPNEFLVDYIRVWKPLNDPDNAKSEKWIVSKSNTQVSAIEASGKIKKKLRHVYDKKRLKQEEGFISFIPQSDKSYALQVNGLTPGNYKINLKDTSGKLVREIANNNVDLSGINQGNYIIEITTNNNQTRQVEIKL